MKYLDMKNHRKEMLPAEEIQPDPHIRELAPEPQQDDREWTIAEEMSYEREQEFQYELKDRADRLNQGLLPFAPDQSEIDYWQSDRRW